MGNFIGSRKIMHLRIFWLLFMLVIIHSIFILAGGMSGSKLSFEVVDGGGVRLDGVFVSLEGVTDQSFKKIGQTNVQGMVVFENVPSSSIYFYSLFKTGHKSSTGNVFLMGDKKIVVKMEKYSENDWWDYYKNNGEVDISFKSFDEDVTYNGGEELNYQISIKNIGSKEIRLNQDGIKIKVFDEFGDGIEWGQINPDLKFEATLKPEGYLKVSADGNDVKITISNAVITYEGNTISIKNNEFITLTLQTSDNVVPNTLYGKYYVVASGDYHIENSKKRIELETQKFLVKNSGADILVRGLNLKKIGDKGYASFEIVNKGGVDLGGIFYEVKAAGNTYHNDMAIRLKRGESINANVNFPYVERIDVFVDYADIIKEVDENNNKAFI